MGKLSHQIISPFPNPSFPPMSSSQEPDTGAALPDAPQGEALRAWLRLANLQFSPRLTAALLRAFPNAPQALFAASDADLDAVPGMLARYLVRLRDPEFDATARQMAWMER